jgi:imidazolonepropionase-like amidohydrolase
MISRTIRLLGFFAGVLAAVAGLAIPAARAQAVVLTGARLIDGTGAAPIEPGTLVILGGRIVTVGPSASAVIPAGVLRIDMAGKTIMPGLVNAHGHLNVDDNTKLPVREHLLERLRTYANYGVTAVYSLGSTREDEVEGIRIRDDQRGAIPDRARLYTGGLNAIGRTPEEARASVARLAGLRVDLIKYHINGNANDMPPDVYGALVDEARRHNLTTFVHIFNLSDAKGAIEKGTDIIAHSVRDRDVDQVLIDLMRARNVAYVPTLTRDLSVFAYEKESSIFADPFFLRGIDVYRTEADILKDPALQQRTRASPQAQRIKAALHQAQRNLKLLSDAGVTVALGSDSGSANDLGRWQGYFEHVEMEMMVVAGMTPMQVLTAATGNAARIMNLDDLGTLQAGKWADLLVLNANPLTDIRNTRRIHSVWIAGRRLANVPP